MPSEVVAVTLEDREAAAFLFPTLAPSILAAEMDETENVQAFARHRLAERERCAKVAEGYPDILTETMSLPPSQYDIAAAIRENAHVE